MTERFRHTVSMRERFTLAVDVGNTRIKFGVFASAEQHGAKPELSECRAALAMPANEPLDWGRIAARFDVANAVPARAAVAGVNPAGIERVLSGWPETWPAPRTIEHAAELPLRVNVELPDHVGIDRLLDAVAANVLRGPGEPAVVVDAGTATTVNFISAAGAFEGGAILPGLELGARALHQHTALLPQVDVQSPELQLVAPLGRDTPAAIRSGLWFGHIGAIREVVSRLAELADRPPLILVTGGNGRGLAQALGREFRYEPDLALRGLAFVAQYG